MLNLGTCILDKATVHNNSISGVRGGAIYNNADLAISDSIISCNHVPETGNLYVGAGALYSARQGSVAITQSLFYGNVANYGGAVINIGSMTIAASTIALNTALNNDAGGILNTGTLSLSNTIIAGNSALKRNQDVYAYNGEVSGSYNLSSFDDWSKSEGNVVWNGSQLFTDTENYDFTPYQNSGAVNSGSNNLTVTKTDLAGNPRIINESVDIGAYENQQNQTEQLPVPSILTGIDSFYVSFGMNRHHILWETIDHAEGYELAYSFNGSDWTYLNSSSASTIITGLSYGSDVMYRVRALGIGQYSNSPWSALKSFNVCPMDINGDGDISSSDRAILSSAWLAEDGDDLFLDYCDINGDGNITNADRSFLANNWLQEKGNSSLVYPSANQADVVFSEYLSADPEAELFSF